MITGKHTYVLFWNIFCNALNATTTEPPEIHVAIQHVSCYLIAHLGPEVILSGKHSSQARDSSSLPLPPVHMGGNKYPSAWARDSSSLPVYYSGGAEGSGGVGCDSGGKYSPAPAGGSVGLSLHLNPTTLAMLQQHNYVPYFRGIKAHLDQGLVQCRRCTH